MVVVLVEDQSVQQPSESKQMNWLAGYHECQHIESCLQYFPLSLCSQDVLSTLKVASTSRREPPKAKDGFLLKRARDKKFLGSEWNKRYFQLEMGQLHFSDGKGAKHKLSDSIEVAGVPISRESPVIIKVESTPALFLKTTSEDEANEWLKILKQHSNYF